MTATGTAINTSRDAWSAWPDTARLYRFSIGLGLRAIGPGGTRAALPRLLNPLAYPRGMEFALTLRGLDLLAGPANNAKYRSRGFPVAEAFQPRRPGSKASEGSSMLPAEARVLDVSSPKLLFLWLAANTRLRLTATDILPDFIAPTRRLLDRPGLDDNLEARLRLQTQDARALSYDDGSFDAVYSISVVEHIPGDGDALALREMARVLRPGGRVCITVPFATRYAEDWVGRDVYERRRSGGERLFYQRRYDDEALERRLVAPSGLAIREVVYFGEPRLRFDRFWNGLPMPARLPFAWAQPLFERAFLRELAAGERERAIGVALTLEKQGGRASGD